MMDSKPTTITAFNVGDEVVIWRRHGRGIYDGNVVYVRAIMPTDYGTRYGLSDANFGEPRGYVESEVLMSVDDFQTIIDSGDLPSIWEGGVEKLADVLERRTKQPDAAQPTATEADVFIGESGVREGDEIEAALWAGAELMGNVSDPGYEDAVKAKTTFANYRARAIALQQKFNDSQLAYVSELQSELENFDKIWSAVTGDTIGKWDYPAQVVRHVEHMRDDLVALRAELAAAKAAVRVFYTALKRIQTAVDDCDMSAVETILVEVDEELVQS